MVTVHDLGEQALIMCSADYNFNMNRSDYCNKVSGKMPLGKKPPIKLLPGKLPPGNMPPRKISHQKIPPRKIAPWKNAPPKNCFTRFLLLLALSYSCSFFNFL